MNNDKRRTSWRDFLENSLRLSDINELEYKRMQQFKHLPIRMTDYYSKNWSGWRAYLEQEKK